MSSIPVPVDLVVPAGEIAANPIAAAAGTFVVAVETLAVARSNPAALVAPVEKQVVPMLAAVAIEGIAAWMTGGAVPIPVVLEWLAVVAVAAALVAAMNLADSIPGEVEFALVKASGSPDSAALLADFPRLLWQPEPLAPCDRYEYAARHTGQ